MRRSAVLLLLAVACAANLVGLNFNDNLPGALVSVDPSSASIAQSLSFESQWLFALTSTVDVTGGTYWLFTMNNTGAYSYAVPLASFSSYQTVTLSQPQIYCAEFEPVSGDIYALSQNSSLIVQLVRFSPKSGDMKMLYNFPLGWQVPFYTSTMISSTYVAVLNSPTGQVMVTWNCTTGAMRSFSLGPAGIVSLATDGTSGSVLALRIQGLTVSLTRQSLVSSAYTTIATLPSDIVTFQYASAVAAGVFYITVRPPTSLTPLLLAVDLSSGVVSTQALPNGTYLAFMQSTAA